ncbi:hypothetical protein BD413DRAFT_176758 [Trametes elegans]|nr:hypothetical protein BD413DRAFT_176758 [Trametes elegans]
MTLRICPAFQYSGTCKAAQCPLDHDGVPCTLCAVVCTSDTTFNAHVQGKKHQAKLKNNTDKSWVTCTVCKINTTAGVPWADHIAGAAHKRRVSALGVSSESADHNTPSELADAHKYCELCRINVYVPTWSAHIASAEHSKQQQAAIYREQAPNGTEPQPAVQANTVTNSAPAKPHKRSALQAYIAFVERLLLPLPEHAPLDKPVEEADISLTLFNGNIKSNPEQLQAVRSIIRMKTEAAPFIIVGLPGTGKATTIAEAVLQILQTQPEACILLYASTDASFERLVQRLTTLTSAELFRHNFPTRPKSTVRTNMLSYFCARGDRFAPPPITQVPTRGVFIATGDGARFVRDRTLPGHFTHIFVYDTAGAITDSDILAGPIRSLAADDARVVLAGDVSQAGTGVPNAEQGKTAKGRNYIESLMGRPLYRDAETGPGRS